MDGRFDKAVRDMLSLEDEAVLLTSAADLVLQEYVLSAPAMSAKHFGLFCRTFARLAPRSQDITYQAAEAALARRALSVENPQPELFDEVRQQVFRGDAGGLPPWPRQSAGKPAPGNLSAPVLPTARSVFLPGRHGIIHSPTTKSAG